MAFECRFGARVASCMSIGLDSEDFEDSRLLVEALNTSSTVAYIDKNDYCHLAKNDRLAVYGDTAATAPLAKDWYNKGGSKAEWDQHRKERLCNDLLAEKGFVSGLDECVNRDAGTTTVSRKMMVTIMEAIFGAVHLRYGDAQLASVMQNLTSWK